MMQRYPEIKEETGYFYGGKKHVWNRTPLEKIDEILYLYKSGTIRTKEIAEKVGVSQIKVQRVLKENSLGNRRSSYPEELRKKIAEFAKQNPNLRQYEIADYFKIHESAVRRALL